MDDARPFSYSLCLIYGVLSLLGILWLRRFD